MYFNIIVSLNIGLAFSTTILTHMHTHFTVIKLTTKRPLLMDRNAARISVYALYVNSYRITTGITKRNKANGLSSQQS